MTGTTTTALADVGSLLGQEFVHTALLAGLPIAVLSGLVGYFMVLRGQVFAGDALSHVAFTGALAALAFGVDARLGLLVSTVAVGALLGVTGARGRADDVVIGTVFAWVLGLGVLALSVYTASAAAATNATAGATVLFGSIFGLSPAQAWTAAALSVLLAAALLAMARPLLFATVDEAVAHARGVPVRLLGVAFLVLVGATAAEATQAVGALLLLGLLAAPAGAATRLTARPYVALVLSAGLALFAMLVGIGASLLLPRVPPSFAVIAVAAATYLTTFVVGPRARRA